MQPVESRDPA